MGDFLMIFFIVVGMFFAFFVVLVIISCITKVATGAYYRTRARFLSNRNFTKDTH